MSKSKGFTLIELMIVIAILGILAAIAVPAITGEHPQQAQNPQPAPTKVKVFWC